MDKPFTTIIVPVYSSTPELLELTKECVSKIVELSSNSEIIVIDDASPCRFDFSSLGVTFIQNAENLGIYANWDLGISKATGEYICIANSDIKPHDGWLTGLQEAEKKFGGFVFPTPIESENDLYNRVYSTYSHGNTYAPCFLFKRDLIEQFKEGDKYFDVGYILWFGDFDMWERAKKNDVKLTSTSKAHVYHMGGGHQTVDLVPKKEEIIIKDKNLFKTRWTSKISA